MGQKLSCISVFLCKTLQNPKILKHFTTYTIIRHIINEYKRHEHKIDTWNCDELPGTSIHLSPRGAMLPGLMLRRRWQFEESPPLERTVSVTAELASSAFRKRLKAQSERCLDQMMWSWESWDCFQLSTNIMILHEFVLSLYCIGLIHFFGDRGECLFQSP